MINKNITGYDGLTKQSKPSEAKKSEKLLEDYWSARSKWATHALEDDQFRNNVQWDRKHQKALEKRGQKASVDNQIHPAVEQAKAVLTANKPRFQATGREMSDMRSASAVSDIMSYIWDISRGNVQLKQVIDDYYVKGMGAFQIYSAKNQLTGENEIYINSINPLDLYIDPASRDPHIRDAANILTAKAMTESQISIFMPSFKDRLPNAQEAPESRYPSTNRVSEEDHEILPSESDSTASSVKRYEVIDRYTKVIVSRHTIYDTVLKKEYVLDQDKYQSWLGEPIAAVHIDGNPPQYLVRESEVHEAIQMQQVMGDFYHIAPNPETGEPTPVPGPAPEGSGFETVFTEILSKADGKNRGVYDCSEKKLTRIKRILTIGGLIAHQSLLECSEYPIITLMNRHNRNPYPISDVRFVKPIQEQINKYESLILAHASNSTNTKVFIPKGSMNRKELEEQWGKAGTAVIDFDAEFGPPIVAGPIALPNELYNNVNNLKKSIYDILGVYPLGQGDPSQAPTTYKGTVAIDEYGQRRMKSKVDDMDAFLNEAARVIVEMIPKVYNKRKVIQLLRPNNISTTTEINQEIYDDTSGAFIEKMNDVTAGTHDLIVVSGSTLPSNRWARFEAYKEMYGMNLIDQEEVLKQTEVVDMEGVLERMGHKRQMERQIEAQEEEIKKLKGDLQTAERESMHDRKRLEVEKFKTKLKETENSAKYSSKLFDARLNDELNIAKTNLVADSSKN